MPVPGSTVPGSLGGGVPGSVVPGFVVPGSEAGVGSGIGEGVGDDEVAGVITVLFAEGVVVVCFLVLVVFAGTGAGVGDVEVVADAVVVAWAVDGTSAAAFGWTTVESEP